MIPPFSYILETSTYFNFEFNNYTVESWVKHDRVRKLIMTRNDQGKITETIETFDEDSLHHSYDDAYSFEKRIDGVTVDWKYSIHGKYFEELPEEVKDSDGSIYYLF